MLPQLPAALCGVRRGVVALSSALLATVACLSLVESSKLHFKFRYVAAANKIENDPYERQSSEVLQVGRVV